MMGIPLTDGIKEFLANSYCVAMNVMSPPTVRACFMEKSKTQDLGIESGFDPEQCVVLAMDYDSISGRLVLVWINQPELIQKSKEGEHA